MKRIQYDDVAPQTLKVAGPGVTGRVVIGKADGADNFCMRVIEVAPGCAIPNHSHPWEHEQFVHAGQGFIRMQGGDLPLCPGTVVFAPANVEHHVVNTGNQPLLIVCLVPSFAPEL